MRVPPVVNVVVEPGGVGIIRNSQNELPPTISASRGTIINTSLWSGGSV